MIIDRVVGEPGHGNYVVDSLNKFDKQYLKKEMFRIFRPEEKHTENHMNDHTATPNGATSLSL